MENKCSAIQKKKSWWVKNKEEKENRGAKDRSQQFVFQKNKKNNNNKMKKCKVLVLKHWKMGRSGGRDAQHKTKNKSMKIKVDYIANSQTKMEERRQGKKSRREKQQDKKNKTNLYNTVW